MNERFTVVKRLVTACGLKSIQNAQLFVSSNSHSQFSLSLAISFKSVPFFKKFGDAFILLFKGPVFSDRFGAATLPDSAGGGRRCLQQRGRAGRSA